MQKQRENVPITATVSSLGLKQFISFEIRGLACLCMNLNHSRVKYVLRCNPERKLHSMNSCVSPSVRSGLKWGGSQLLPLLPSE